MSLQHTEAVVLSQLRLGEADRIITFFSPHWGKFKGIAKGSRSLKSKLLASTLPLTQVDVWFREKRNTGLHQLSQCDIINSFQRLKQDLKKLTAGFYVTELVNIATWEAEPGEGVFGLLLWVLGALSAGEHREAALRIFEIRLAALLGYKPQLDGCINCGQQVGGNRSFRFSLTQGGIICGECRRGTRELKLSLGSLNFLRQALRLNLEKVGRLTLTAASRKELREILPAYLKYHLERNIRSLRFLNLLEG